MNTDFMDHRSAIENEIERCKNQMFLGPIDDYIKDLTEEQREKIDKLYITAQNFRENYVKSLQKLLQYVNN